MNNNALIPDLLWILLTLICIIAILYGLDKALKRTGWDRSKQQRIWYGSTIAVLVWTTLVCLLSYKGFFADFSKLPPRPALALLIPLPFVMIAAFSKSGTKLLQSVPPQWLVFIQSFRIVVELLLLFAYLKNRLPIQMTFEGMNFDVVTGILALPAGYFLLKRKTFAPKLAITFNIVGFLLLLNILIIAVLSMPTPFRYFMNEPANTLVAEFPFILLPGLLVPVAYSFHIFSLRQLLTKK